MPIPGPGPRAELEAPAWSATERTWLLAFSAAIAVSLIWLVHPWYDARTDAAIYINTARSVLAGEGYSLLGEPFRVRPPGFSLLIAPVIAARGADFLLLNAWVALLGAGLCVALAVFLRARIGLPLALLTASAIWLNPGYLRLCNQVLSDVPGTTLLFGCLLLERWSARAPPERAASREILLGLAIGLATYVRSITILLLPAIVVSRLVERWLSRDSDPPAVRFAVVRLALTVTVALGVVTPWSLRNAAVAPSEPVDQTMLYDYSTAMWHRDPGDPNSPRKSLGEVLSVVPLRVHQVAAALGSRLQSQFRGRQLPVGETHPLYPLTTLLLLGCLAGVGLLRRAPADVFMAGVLFVIAIYFGFSPRLLVPVFVLALGSTVEVAYRLGARWLPEARARLVVAAGLVLLIAMDFDPRRGWSELEAEHEAYTARAEAVSAVLAPEARVASLLGFRWSLYLERPVYSLQQAAIRAAHVEGVETVIDRYGIDAVVLSPAHRTENTLVPYFRERYGPGTRAGDAIVWKVRPRVSPD